MSVPPPAAIKENDHPLKILIKVLEKVKNNARGVYIIFFNLSHLRPYNRMTHQLNSYKSLAEKIFSRNKAKAFSHKSGDIIVFLRSDSLLNIEKNIPTFRSQLPDDPFFDDMRAKNLYTIFDVHNEYASCMTLIEEYLIEEVPEYRLTAVDILDFMNIDEGLSHNTDVHMIPPAKASEILNVIRNADLTNFIRRQNIIWFENEKHYKPISVEYYTCSRTFESFFNIPGAFLSNPWFFKHLTLHFDRKILSYLIDIVKKNKDGIALNINLNTRTVITSHFFRFLEQTSSYNLRLTVELDKLDLINNYNGFAFARQHLKSKEINFCLDGIEYYDLKFFNLGATGVEAIKLFWSSEYLDNLDPETSQKVLQEIRRIIDLFGPEKIILARCDSPKALEIGLSLGLHQFQGHYIEELLK
jgi:hypothetical protein